MQKLAKITFLAWSMVITVSACSVPSQWRADRIPGDLAGEWVQAPEVVLDTRLTDEQVAIVKRELKAMVSCDIPTRFITPKESRELLVYGGLRGRVLVTNLDPMRPSGGGTCEWNFTNDRRIQYAEVRITKWTSKVVRHELVHAIGGVNHNTGKGDLLMDEKSHEEIPGTTLSKGMVLLPFEERAVCASVGQ